MGFSLNTFIEEVYLAIMGQMNITDNLDQMYKTILVEVDSNGIPKKNIQFNSNLKSKANGIQCVRAFKNTVVSQPFMTFVDDSGIIKLSHITGLTADTEYQLVLLVLGS